MFNFYISVRQENAGRKWCNLCNSGRKSNCDDFNFDEIL